MKISQPIKYSVYILTLLLTIQFSIQAQNNTGKLTGKVTDSSTNQSLYAVNVIVNASGKGVTTISDGSYILSLAPGTYTIRYSYTGYATKDIGEIIIKKGETTFMDVNLAPKSSLANIVITSTKARLETQSAVYSRQKNMAAASDGIGAEAMRKMPEVNVAGVIKRVTGINVQDNRFVVVRGLGDQYNQTMLNGVLMTSTESNRNAFALDLIPAAVLDNITVNKTATPDMPGNFAGGIVQINTKDFPANDFYSISLGSGFSDQTFGKKFYSDSRGNAEFLGFGVKERNLPRNFPSVTNKIGDIGQLSELEQQRYLRMLKNNLAPINNGPSKPNESVQLGFGKTIKFKNQSQIGIVAAISQRKTELIEEEIVARDPNLGQSGTADNREILGLNYYSQNMRYKYNSDFGGVVNFAYSFGKNKVTLKNLITQIFNNTFTERPTARVSESRFPNYGSSPVFGLTFRPEQKRIINSILSGEHRAGKENDTRIEWNLNTTFNNTKNPDTRNFLLALAPDGTLSTNANLSTAESALQQNSRIWSEDKDIIYGGAFNITTAIKLFKNKQLFKSGILFQNRGRKTNSVMIVYQGLSDKVDDLLSPNKFYTQGVGLSLLQGIASSTGTYNSGSSLLAAYESIENKIGKKTRIIWGIRAENYQQYVNVYDPVFFPNFRDFDLNINGFAAKTTFNFLPSVNLVYALTKKINIRLAYSKTVARPELKDLAAFPRYDYQTFVVSQGNPNLKSTSIKNYDFKFEIFPGAGEIISCAAFYKQLKNPIEYARNPNSTAFIQPLNVGNTFVRGIEAEIRKKLDFIHFAPWLENFTVFGNGTLLKSKVATQILNDFIFPSITEHTLIGQPEYIINAGISIAALKNTFEATLSYNKTGDYIYQLGSSEKNYLLTNGEVALEIPHTRINPRDLVDITISQDLFKNKCKVKFNISNLLNNRYIAYQDINDNGKFDETLLIDIKAPEIDRNSYLSGSDNTTSSIKAQRSYSFTITYTF